MKDVTYKGRTDEAESGSVVYDGERFRLEQPVRVTKETADKLAQLEDFSFSIAEAKGPDPAADTDDADTGD